MDYKKKYEEAILRMNKWVEGSEIIEPKEVAEFVFPELKESEDERIRKAIKLLVEMKENDSIGFEPVYGASYKEMITWLEKQDPNRLEKEIELAYKTADEVQYRRGYEAAKREFEKQGEKKSQGKSALEVWKDMRLEVYQQASGNRHEVNCSGDSIKMFSLNDIDEIFEKIAE